MVEGPRTPSIVVNEIKLGRDGPIGEVKCPEDEHDEDEGQEDHCLRSSGLPQKYAAAKDKQCKVHTFEILNEIEDS